MDLAREYVLLGLRFDRLSTGFGDAYTGDPRVLRNEWHIAERLGRSRGFQILDPSHASVDEIA